MRKHKHKPFWILRELFRRLVVIIGSVILTMIFFLVLPLMQTLAKPPTMDMVVQSIDTAKLEAPEPPPEIEQEEKPQQEEQPPELTEEMAPLDLSQLELALNPGFGDSMMGGDFAVKLNTVVSGDQNSDALFSIADLDQTPRVIYQTGPVGKDWKKKAPGKVYVLFIVNQQGRVEDPIILTSSDPALEKPAIDTVKTWKFEPGKHSGKAVRFRMRVAVVFPKGD